MSTAQTRYFEAARDAGVPADQLRLFARAKVVLQEQQLKASALARLCDRSCDHDTETRCHEGCAPTKIGYGGARGGGKSHWGLAQIFCDDCARYPGLKFLYLRKVGRAGKEAVNDLRRDVLHSTPHDYRVSDNVLVRRDNGSRVILGHFQAEKDIDNYLGLQYDGALIEEATQLSSSKIKNIATCIRSAKPGWRPRQYFTTNPGNIGHGWFKAAFIAPKRAGKERATRFVQATVRDNRFVNPEYREELESLTGWQRRAWLEGDWDIAAGQYFTTFRREVHVIADLEVPANWRVWMGLDYGFTHYTTAYLFAQADGQVYVVDEHAERGWLVSRHARAIKAMLDRNGVDVARLEAIKAGQDCFSKRHTGGTIAAEYAAEGLRLTPANDDRIAGAAEFLRRFGAEEEDRSTRPTIRIANRCHRLIECLPLLQHDDDRPEDVKKVDCDEDGNGGDDPYDGARYGLMHAANRRTSKMS